MKALAGGLIVQADAAYAWLDQYDNVLPIWGIQREQELDEFIGYMRYAPVLSAELKEIIKLDRTELAEAFCRGCGYCTPGCPAKIQINLCARMSQMIRRSPSTNWLSVNGQAVMKKIEECTKCGQCMTKCPYHLNIPQLLKKHYEDYQNILSGAVSVA
jgi:predicted aldo/keto reductase-like oxidoreductase